MDPLHADIPQALSSQTSSALSIPSHSATQLICAPREFSMPAVLSSCYELPPEALPATFSDVCPIQSLSQEQAGRSAVSAVLAPVLSYRQKKRPSRFDSPSPPRQHSSGKRCSQADQKKKKKSSSMLHTKTISPHLETVSANDSVPALPNVSVNAVNNDTVIDHSGQSLTLDDNCSADVSNVSVSIPALSTMPAVNSMMTASSNGTGECDDIQLLLRLARSRSSLQNPFRAPPTPVQTVDTNAAYTRLIL